MVLAVFVIIIAALVVLASSGNKAREKEAFNKLSEGDKKNVATERKRQEQEIIENVAIIQPIIRNDK